MHNANSESSEMLVSIKRAGDNLNESTDKLKTLAASLDTASTAVVEQQKEATAKFVEMQQENLNIISQLSTALSDAKNMVDSYTSDFETLKGGMKEVFKGINDGLKDYSATLRESTGSALAEYSDALTKSTDGLKNIAAALEESAEELSDSIDKFKRLR
jgi:methyl-accepting chemotaxis protein